MAIPVTVPSLLGPITVQETDQLPIGWSGASMLGKRSIGIDPSMAGSEYGRATLWHEWIHFALYDTGVQDQLSKEQLEGVCTGVALALTKCGIMFPATPIKED